MMFWRKAGTADPVCEISAIAGTSNPNALALDASLTSKNQLRLTIYIFSGGWAGEKI